MSGYTENGGVIKMCTYEINDISDGTTRVGGSRDFSSVQLVKSFSEKVSLPVLL